MCLTFQKLVMVAFFCTVASRRVVSRKSATPDDVPAALAEEYQVDISDSSTDDLRESKDKNARHDHYQQIKKQAANVTAAVWLTSRGACKPRHLDIETQFCCGSRDKAHEKKCDKANPKKEKDPKWHACMDELKCKDPGRVACPGYRRKGNKGLRCGWHWGEGDKCECMPGHCWDGNSCLPAEELEIRGPSTPEDQEGARIDNNLDFVAQLIDEADVIDETTGNKIDTVRMPAKSDSRSSRALGTIGNISEGIAGDVVGGVLHTALQPLFLAASELGGFLGGRTATKFLSGNQEKVEQLIQWVLANFVLFHDQPKRSCETKGGIKKWFGTTSPAYGKCYFDLSLFGWPYPDDPMSFPLYSYDNGRQGANHRKFDIILAVRLSQLRGLEALQVQKSRCYGNLLNEGGFCEMEFKPHGQYPLEVTDIDFEIYCEGNCDTGSLFKSLINDPDAMPIGAAVYVKAAGNCAPEALGKVWMLKQHCEGEICEEHKCVKTTNWLGKPRGKNLGCHPKSQLQHASECPQGKGYFARVWEYVAGSEEEEPVVNKRSLMHLRFDVKVRHAKIRTRLNVYRTRSLEEHANDLEDNDAKQGFQKKVSRFFDAVKKGLKAARHPREALLSNKALIEDHEMNFIPVRDKYGKVTSYDLATCKWPRWNPDATPPQANLPVPAKCYKLTMEDMALIPLRGDWIELEQKPFVPDEVDEKPPTTDGQLESWGSWAFGFAKRRLSNVTWAVGKAVGMAYKTVAGAILWLLGYANTGVTLSIAQGVSRMMFARDVVMVLAPNGKQYKYCKDKWKVSSFSAEKSEAAGVVCEQDNPETGEGEEDEVATGNVGVAARFEFEFVELPPEWKRKAKGGAQHEQVFGIRGGYKGWFCRVVTPKVNNVAKEQRKHEDVVGLVKCDVRPPTDPETGSKVYEKCAHDYNEPALKPFEEEQTCFPKEAIFYLVHQHEHKSKLVFKQSDAPEDAKVGQQPKDANTLKTTKDADEVHGEWDKDTTHHASDAIYVYLKSASLDRYCGVKQKVTAAAFDGFFDRKYAMLVCDKERKVESVKVKLEGNTDPFVPNKVWDHFLSLILSCVGTGVGVGIGLQIGGLAAVLFGSSALFWVTTVSTVIGGSLGIVGDVAKLYKFGNWDANVMRWFMKSQAQQAGMMVMNAVESTIELEFPRP